MNILLDTNVASQILRPRRISNQHLWKWFDEIDGTVLRLCRIVDAEVKFGAYGHPDAMQSRCLLTKWRDLVLRINILEFTAPASDIAARFRGRERRRGRQVSFPDAAIAGIALANNCALATRNTKDFEGSDLILINPFEPSPGGISP